MAKQTKKCPLCAEQIPLEATSCEYCGAKFSVTVSGYCITCHELREADTSSHCKVCQTEVADLQVESSFIEEHVAPPAPPPAVPVGVDQRGGPLDRYLEPGEQFFYRTKGTHKLLAVLGIFCIIFAVIAGWVAVAGKRGSANAWEDWIIFGVFLPLGCFCLLCLTLEFAVTNRRFLRTFLGRLQLDIPLTEIADIQVGIPHNPKFMVITCSSGKKVGLPAEFEPILRQLMQQPATPSAPATIPVEGLERSAPPTGMSLLQLYFSPQGRIGRLTFFLKGILPATVVLGICDAIIFSVSDSGDSSGYNGVVTVIPFVILLVYFWVYLMLLIKRFHDLNRSGWKILYWLIPLAGQFIYIANIIQCFFMKSVEPNRFGDRTY